MKSKTLNALKRDGIALLATAGDTAGTDANLLLAHACGISIAALLASGNTLCTDEQAAHYTSLLALRQRGMPMAYILESREFMSLPFLTNSDVLIPRPDTETLVETLLHAHEQTPFARGLEIGTGSGCISVALAHYGRIDMLALDISEAALSVARHNAKRNGVQGLVAFLHSDIYGALTRAHQKHFDFIVSNPPYIRTADIPRLDATVRDYEPHRALDGGESGLVFYERLAANGAEYLKSGGRICLEIGHDQRLAVTQILLSYGFFDIMCKADLAGLDRVLVASHA